MEKYIYNIARSSASEIRETLIAIRKNMGITQGEVARIAGITQSAVSKYERGEVESTPLDLIRAYITATGAGMEAMIFFHAREGKESNDGR